MIEDDGGGRQNEAERSTVGRKLLRIWDKNVTLLV